VPCGIADKGVTSIRRLARRSVRMDEVADITAQAFVDVFGRAPVRPATSPLLQAHPYPSKLLLFRKISGIRNNRMQLGVFFLTEAPDASAGGAGIDRQDAGGGQDGRWRSAVGTQSAQTP